ncbi:MAG TPA: neutral/alkaline non-lysosomal ceramidase N-terminal domain-containing protein [Isosphaeraceae bacterium]|jgi:hypothetical protein|nr:neutral/alkaline non-lysosomal ceramidase N-terminal domain-containing protein [Isosphaeraceae bacterium]
MTTRIKAAAWLSICFVLVATTVRAGDRPHAWKAGVASVDTTPSKPIWMSGYASRKTPSEGVVHPLHAKALALADEQGHKVVIITADIIGFNRAFTQRVTDRLNQKHGLPREDIVLFASHTHTGPMLGDTVDRMKAYGIDPEKAQNNVDYTKELEDKIVDIVGKALGKMKPASLGFTVGRAGFAMNRREKTDKGFKIGVNPNGSTDKHVPVLVIDTDGKTMAVVFGYACHNTTLTGEMMKISGDYAGFAQEQIEKAIPGSLAMFIVGCAGDANPEPRGTLEQARQHGKELADAVLSRLESKDGLEHLTGPLRTAYMETTLHFAGPTDRASYEQRLKEPNTGRQRHAKRIIEAIDNGETIRAEVPYPVQALGFGDHLTILGLGCEVVSEYSGRLQMELGEQGRSLWVAAYANDVFGYIASVRVLLEGGYEGLEAYYSSTFPTPLRDDVEDTIVKTAREVAEKVQKP